MSKRVPMRNNRDPKATSLMSKGVRVGTGHTLILGTAAGGKSVYQLLRITEDEMRRIRSKPADRQADAGDEAWV